MTNWQCKQMRIRAYFSCTGILRNEYQQEDFMEAIFVCGPAISLNQILLLDCVGARMEKLNHRGGDERIAIANVKVTLME